MKNFIKYSIISFILASGQLMANNEEIEQLQRQIISLAKSYEGLGDPDFSKQKNLEKLVNELIDRDPQPPVKDRLNLLYGVWKQVWGPYDYRSDNRGVDPEFEPREIYQVVSSEGYYYNVAPNYKNGDRNKLSIGLLKGTYQLDPENPNNLLVKFQKNTSIKYRPTDMNIYDLPELSEAGTLLGERRILPDFLVRWLFGGGALNEVYTTEHLRILFGSNSTNFKKKFIYIMIKI